MAIEGNSLHMHSRHVIISFFLRYRLFVILVDSVTLLLLPNRHLGPCTTPTARLLASPPPAVSATLPSPCISTASSPMEPSVKLDRQAHRVPSAKAAATCHRRQ
jgi:hypothetical protein